MTPPYQKAEGWQWLMDKIDGQGGEGGTSRLLLSGAREPPYIGTWSPRSYHTTMGQRYLGPALSRPCICNINCKDKYRY